MKIIYSTRKLEALQPEEFPVTLKRFSMPYSDPTGRYNNQLNTLNIKLENGYYLVYEGGFLITRERQLKWLCVDIKCLYPEKED